MMEPDDLEAHIPRLRDLDRVRSDSAKLRDSGLEALKVWMESEKYQTAALSEQAVAARVRWQMSSLRGEENRKPLEAAAGKIILEHIVKDEFSVLAAAHTMRALAAHNRLALSKETIICWYWIVRELFSTRAYCVNNVPRGKAIAHSKLRVTRPATAKQATFMRQVRTGSAMDCPVDTTATQ